MIKAIVIDFFGVFCPDTSLEWLRKNPDFEQLLPFHQAICDRSDRGELNRSEFYEEEAKLTNKNIEDVRQVIEDEFYINNDLVALVRSLHKKYKVAILSNTNVGWVEPRIEQAHLEDCFDELVLSSLTGYAKPDKHIFEITASKLNVSFNEMVFIDDRESNVVPADSYGIKSILFTDVTALKKELRILDIDIKF